jgi:signal transduction histidine kinase
MERLVKDLASSSDPPTGRFEVEVVKADLAAIARQQAELSGILSELHSISVEAPKRLTLACDPDRIAQVFANLLTNAVRHTSGGAIVVRVWSEDRHARVSIQDAGKRLAANQLPTIFEPSSGLGLSIARAIVEAHGGRMWAERARGKGTAFQFSLPLAKRQPKRGGAVRRPQRPAVNAARQN